MRIFVNTVRAELLKMSRSVIWLILLVIPMITAVMGSMNYSNNLGVLTPGWKNLWTQHSLFLCYFFLPAMVGIICSYLWHFEHQRNNWNIMLTQPVSMTALVLAKIFVASLLLGFTLCVVSALFVISGFVLHLPGDFPADFGIWMLRGWFAGIGVISVQSAFSLFIRNFAGPVALSMILGIAGLAINVQGLGLYFPFSLLQISMNSNSTSGLDSQDSIIFAVMTLIFIVVPALLSIWALKRKDVDSK